MAGFWEEARARGAAGVAAIDFEGTPRSGVIEYGVVLLGPGGVGEARTGFCRPLRAPHPRDLALSGISPAAVEGGPPFADHFARFRAWRCDHLFLAHHAAVENGFLTRHFPVAGDVPDWRVDAGRTETWGPWLDTRRLAAAWNPDPGGHGLEEAVARTGAGAELEDLAARWCPPDRRRWHAALYDALACALLFTRLLRDRPDAGLGDCLRLSEGSREARSTWGQGNLFG